MSSRHVLVIWPFGFRSFDWDRLELEYLATRTGVEVVELLDFLNPHAKSAYAERMLSHRVCRVSSFVGAWSALKGLRGAGKGVISMNFVRPDSFRALAVLYLLKIGGTQVVDYYNSGLQDEAAVLSARGYAAVQLKLKYVQTFGEGARKLRFGLCRIIAEVFRLYPTHRVVAGRVHEGPQVRYCQKRSIRLIRGSSWDYSRWLREKAGRPGALTNTAVWLDSASPAFHSDALVLGIKDFLTSEKWYPALRRFFDQVERTFSCSVVIAPHPKTNPAAVRERFGAGRKVIAGRTRNLVQEADVIFTRGSTAISYAVVHRKPVLLLTSDELLRDRATTRSNRALEQALGVPVCNIDHPPNDDELRRLTKVNERLYSSFIQNNLSSRNDERPNYQVLLDELNCAC